MNVLVLNAGSSSLKFQGIATDMARIKHHGDARLCRGQVERIGGEAIITVQVGNGPRQKTTAPLRHVSAALDYALPWLAWARARGSRLHDPGACPESKLALHRPAPPPQSE